jgi:hypothetical protein
VAYPHAWPGIDVLYERASGFAGLKSAYLVAPGADPGLIHLAWRGIAGARLLEDGTLELAAPDGILDEARRSPGRTATMVAGISSPPASRC